MISTGLVLFDTVYHDTTIEIVVVDSGSTDGTLEIGPQSAGAVPGPACYGRGGADATISDANLLLGRLPTERSLSGGLVLDKGKADFVAVGSADSSGRRAAARRSRTELASAQT